MARAVGIGRMLTVLLAQKYRGPMRANKERVIWESVSQWKYERDFEQRLQQMFAIAVPKINRRKGNEKGVNKHARTSCFVCESIQRAAS